MHGTHQKWIMGNENEWWMDDGNKANQTGFTHHIKNSHFLRFLEKMKRLLVGLTYLKGERPSTHLGIDYIECVSVFPRFTFFFY